MWILRGVLAAVTVVLLSGVRVYKEYERATVFRLGRARSAPLGPGMQLLLPLGIDRAIVVDTRTKVIQIPTQEVQVGRRNGQRHQLLPPNL